MVGMVILTNPQFVFWWTDGKRGYDLEEYPNFGWGVVAALGNSVSSAIAYLFIRRIGSKVDPAATVCQFGAFAMVTGIPIMYIMAENHQVTSIFAYDWTVVCLMLGILALGFFS